jgi:hypothetical protein
MDTLLDQVNQLQAQQSRGIGLTKKKIVHALAASAIVLAGILIISMADNLAGRDFISYWSAGKMLIHRGDPYSIAHVLALENANGYSGTSPLTMLNPPWALFLTVPLGFGSPASGLFLWTLATAGCIVAFIRLLKLPVEDRMFAFLFAPAVAVFRLSQSSPFLLLGFSLFLYFYRRRPFLAGASLLFMAIKPHLFLVFWVVLLVDCIYRRSLLLFAGLLSALVAATAFAMCFDVHIWQHYFAMLRGLELGDKFFPTTSMVFRLSIDARATWLLFVPSGAAIVWGLWYYVCNRRAWDWRLHGMLLMLVTVAVSPYSWFPDEVVLLPSLAFVFTLPRRRKHAVKILVAINMLALLVLMVGHPSLSSGAYLWTPLAWLMWFLYATDGFRAQGGSSTIQSKEVKVSLDGGVPLGHGVNLLS